MSLLSHVRNSAGFPHTFVLNVRQAALMIKENSEEIHQRVVCGIVPVPLRCSTLRIDNEIDACVQALLLSKGHYRAAARYGVAPKDTSAKTKHLPLS